MKEIIGTFSVDVVDVLSKHSIKKDIPEEGTPIYLGQSNIEHMKKSHPSDYEKYGDDIKLILADPDYIRNGILVPLTKRNRTV